MSELRTYRLAALNATETQRVVVAVDSTNEREAMKAIRAQLGDDVAKRVRVLSSQVVGSNKLDERDYTVRIQGIPIGRSPHYRTTSADKALSLATAEHGDAVEAVGMSTRITDAQFVMEEVRSADPEMTIEEVASSIGLIAAYRDGVEASEYEGGSVEHFEFADGSVLDADGGDHHDSIDDLMSELGEAAHEQMVADFHAGDSGFRDPGSDVKQAHADRAALRSLDNAKPALASDLASSPTAPGGDATTPDR